MGLAKLMRNNTASQPLDAAKKDKKQQVLASPKTPASPSQSLSSSLRSLDTPSSITSQRRSLRNLSSRLSLVSLDDKTASGEFSSASSVASPIPSPSPGVAKKRLSVVMRNSTVGLPLVALDDTESVSATSSSGSTTASPPPALLPPMSSVMQSPLSCSSLGSGKKRLSSFVSVQSRNSLEDSYSELLTLKETVNSLSKKERNEIAMEGLNGLQQKQKKQQNHHSKRRSSTSTAIRNDIPQTLQFQS